MGTVTAREAYIETHDYVVEDAPDAPEAAPSRRLWDIIDGDWTAPLPQYMVPRHLLKMVFRCSCCRFTAMHLNEARDHLRQVQQSGQDHQQARITQLDRTGGGNSWSCDACGAAFRSQAQGNQHLEDRRAAPAAHAEARVLPINRFVLGPPPAPGPRTPSCGVRGAPGTDRDPGTPESVPAEPPAPSEATLQKILETLQTCLRLLGQLSEEQP